MATYPPPPSRRPSSLFHVSQPSPRPRCPGRLSICLSARPRPAWWSLSPPHSLPGSALPRSLCFIKPHPGRAQGQAGPGKASKAQGLLPRPWLFLVSSARIAQREKDGDGPARGGERAGGRAGPCFKCLLACLLASRLVASSFRRRGGPGT